MSTRAELPENLEADEHHDIVREATIEYLRTKASREERKEVLKEAIDEWLDKKAAELGKMSARVIVYTLLAMVAYYWIMHSGNIIKPH